MPNPDDTPTGSEREAMLALLTDEERAAMEDGAAEEAAALAAIANGAIDDDDDDEGGDGGEAPGAPAPAQAPAQAPVQAPATAPVAAPAAAPAEGAQAPVPAPAPAPATSNEQKPFIVEVDEVDPLPVYRVEKTDFKPDLDALDAREAELQAKLDANDIEPRDFAVELRKINNDRAVVLSEQSTARTIMETNKGNEQANNARFERSFIKAVSKDGIDYTQTKNLRLFNTMIEEAADELPEGATKLQLWSEAHRRVALARGVQLGKTAAPPAPAAAPAPTAAPAAPTPPPSRKMNPKDAPATLAHVAGGQAPEDTGGDPFADLDRLDGVEYEAALNRLTPAQREQYLAG